MVENEKITIERAKRTERREKEMFLSKGEKRNEGKKERGKIKDKAS
jgi:hypothetical protein